MSLARIMPLLTAFILCLSSCTTVKRFKSASYKGEQEGLVEVSLFGTRLDTRGEDAGHSLWDLGPGAQTKLIEVLDKRHYDNAAFGQALSRTYLPGGEGAADDYSSAGLRMVFTIRRALDHAHMVGSDPRFSPADRIVSLSFGLELTEEGPLQFTGWNRYSTEYGEIELAEMSFDQSLELDLQASGEILEGGLSRSSGRNEKQVLRSRYMKLSGSIAPHALEVREEGSRELDLCGNVSADVQLSFSALAEKLWIPSIVETEEGELQLQDLQAVDVRVPRMEKVPEKITATLHWGYVYRHVEKGWKTFGEWDDRVAFYTGSHEEEVVLFTRAELLPDFYMIGLEEDGRRRPLRLRLPGGGEYALQFRSYADAVDFHNWLARESGKDAHGPGEKVSIGNKVLLYGNAEVDWQDVSTLGGLKVMPLY